MKDLMTYYYRRGNKYFFKRGNLKLSFETDSLEVKKFKRGEFRIVANYEDGTKKTL